MFVVVGFLYMSISSLAVLLIIRKCREFLFAHCFRMLGLVVGWLMYLWIVFSFMYLVSYKIRISSTYLV